MLPFKKQKVGLNAMPFSFPKPELLFQLGVINDSASYLPVCQNKVGLYAMPLSFPKLELLYLLGVISGSTSLSINHSFSNAISSLSIIIPMFPKRKILELLLH